MDGLRAHWRSVVAQTGGTVLVQMWAHRHIAVVVHVHVLEGIAHNDTLVPYLFRLARRLELQAEAPTTLCRVLAPGGWHTAVPPRVLHVCATRGVRCTLGLRRRTFCCRYGMRSPYRRSRIGSSSGL